MLPERIGRYEIAQILGRGGAAVVYLARDPVIDRLVALKTLRRDLNIDHAEEFRPRFLREARAAGRLSHPGIVTIFDAGEDEEQGVLFIAMEFVDGSSLKDLIRSGAQLPPGRVAELGCRLAEALEFAHNHGVVHRDIKPANIMLTRSGQAKIADFGIARIPTPESTVEGMILGTPSYMSPEQVVGRPVDGRTDLYSLGVVLYELLLGRVPFSGDSLEELSVKILQQQPPEILESCPELAPGFAPVIRQCLAKRPQDRYQSGGALARALAAAVGSGAAVGLGASIPGSSPQPTTGSSPTNGEGADEAFSTTLKTGEVSARVQAEAGRTGATTVPGRRAPRLRLALYVALGLAVALAGGSLLLRHWPSSAGALTAPPLTEGTATTAIEEASRRLENGDLSGAVAATTAILDRDPASREAKAILDEAHRRIMAARTPVTITASFPSPSSRGTLRVSVDGTPLDSVSWNFDEKIVFITRHGKGKVHALLMTTPGRHQLRVRLDRNPDGPQADTSFTQSFPPGSRWLLGLDTSGKNGKAAFTLRRTDSTAKPTPTPVRATATPPTTR